MYLIFSLNGTWEMKYAEQAYTGTEYPWNNENSILVENAVPRYWEDMKLDFAHAPFRDNLRINPEYGTQSYPMENSAPDMALPNILGNFFYRSRFCCEDVRRDAVIHFEGVQNAVSVWLNRLYLGRHEGYSTPFDIEIPDGALHDGDNEIVLSVSNIGLTGYDDEPVSGLTNRAANQYTGGITGDVELRYFTSPLRDASVQISEDCNYASVSVELTQTVSFTWTVFDEATELLSGTAEGSFQFPTDGLSYWTPDSPKLYRLQIVCGDAILDRTFGVRRLVADDVHLKLNSVPVFLRGICEHCYYPETVHPNHDSAFYRNVIRKIKELGFNFIRFHTHIPEEEYMQAADELGILVEVESPNNTSLEEWKKIVRFCRRHTAVVMYSCGNELQMDDPFIAHQKQCADEVHRNTDSLFSPMSAMRGLEYHLIEEDQVSELVHEPFTHHPRRFKQVGEFSDVYNSFTLGITSYESLKADAEKLDRWSCVYNKPRLSHEICIQGCYADLSLESRYDGTAVGKTEMFSSVRRHLKEKGLLKKAPVYFKNSSEWQRRLRKHNFETVRLCQNMAGFDFLGPIDTHWHTFGYDVGMMNEFYELKPGETVRNVRMYNSSTVLLNDLGTNFNFTAGQTLQCGIYVSHYDQESLCNARLHIRLTMRNRLIYSDTKTFDVVKTGMISKLMHMDVLLPESDKPAQLQLYATLECGDTYAENEWELYLFPPVTAPALGNLLLSDDMSAEQLLAALDEGRDILLTENAPFATLPTSFQMALAGRTFGNLATVIKDHPSVDDMPNDGFCGWQFRQLLEGGRAVCFETENVPFDPIIEVVSTHKHAVRQAALFEVRALNGKLLVCTFNFSDSDPAALWFKKHLIDYANSKNFEPQHVLSADQINALMTCKVKQPPANENFAFNVNDITAIRKKK